jgi:hypothetical protein
MNQVCHHPANLAGQTAHGVKAPSVRTPPVPNPPAGPFQPYQYAFRLAHHQTTLPGAAADSWDVEYEFLDLDTQASVTANTLRVDWVRPQSRLFPRTPAGGTAAGDVPAFTEHPGATPFAVGVPHRIRVNYT